MPCKLPNASFSPNKQFSMIHCLFYLLAFSFWVPTCLNAQEHSFSKKTPGVSFPKARFNQGVFCDKEGEAVVIPLRGLNKDRGTIEFWLSCEFSLKNRDISSDYPFLFSICNLEKKQPIMQPTLGIHFDPQRRLVFDIVLDVGAKRQYMAVSQPLDWEKGSWHYIAATWTDKQIKLFIDGRQVSESSCKGLGEIFASEEAEIYIGNHASYPQFFSNTIIDELRISDIARSQEQIRQSFKEPVAWQADKDTLLIEHFDQPEKFTEVEIRKKRMTSSYEWEELKKSARFILEEGWKPAKNIGFPVNTSGWEDSANISFDGKRLYFTYLPWDLVGVLEKGEVVVSGPKRGFNLYNADIFVCERDEQGNWGEPKILEFCRQEFSEIGPQETADGSRIYLSGNFGKYGFGKNDIWAVTLEAGQWGNFINLGNTLNSAYFEEDPSISREEDEIYFWSDDLPGGLGGHDIWVSKKKNNVWSKPENLGEPINSVHNDFQPHLVLAGDTLYFTSDRGGQGSAIFKSRRRADGSWMQPEVVISADPSTGAIGVGEPTLTSDGKFLYFVTAYRSKYGEYDCDIMFIERQ